MTPVSSHFGFFFANFQYEREKVFLIITYTPTQAISIDEIREAPVPMQLAMTKEELIYLPYEQRFRYDEKGFGTSVVIAYEPGAMLTSKELMQIGCEHGEYYSLEHEIVDKSR